MLVVLGMLTFFSILVATYLVFSSQSRQSSFVIASRNTRNPDVRGLIDEALMTLIRGTNDVNDPFYGEDLLSDYYGRFDAISLQVKDATALMPGFSFDAGGGFARVPIALGEDSSNPGGNSANDAWDDVYTGRVVTFLEGPLANRTFRIIRTKVNTDAGGYYTIYIEFPADLVASGVVSSPPTESQLRNLFYSDSDSDFPSAGYQLHMNGAVRNSPGIGFDGTSVALPATPQMAPAMGLGYTLPRALQPSHIGRKTPKMTLDAYGMPTGTQGDFDESYDAADYFNWFLSYREIQRSDVTAPPTVKVTPSFHRPAVINYILNEPSLLSGFLTNQAERRNALVSLSRATFRPLPISSTMIPLGVNARFTGSNSNFALRTPIDLSIDGQSQFRMDQLAKALIGSPGDWNPWDVDNDGDGLADSIWMDLGLPLITSREGKLLKPLVAPMIEDLSGRLNVNAHSNYELAHDRTSGGIEGRSTWASTRSGLNNPASNQAKFRGIGYGPAEIAIPAPQARTTDDPVLYDSFLSSLRDMRIDRYQFGSQAYVINAPPGVPGQDGLDVLRNGFRPPLHAATSGYGYSLDPYGRAAIGLGRGGHLLMANSGSEAPVAGGNESIDDPYEFDPTGRLSGDNAFTFADLEPILNSNAFDIELLPRRLQFRLQALVEAYPEYENSFTTSSVSDDSLALPAKSSRSSASQLHAIVELLTGPSGSLTEAQIEQLVAPELRLGRKIDVNRPFGNGVDDDGNGVIDEPRELLINSETNRAFVANVASGQTIPPAFQNQTPSYSFGEPIDARQLLARHLYVLMMALSDQAVFPSVTPGTPIPEAEQNAYRARRIAQWAINVVDYRDADSVMTRFVFDPNPRDGWNPDFTNPSHVVWGVEQPELLLSESMGLHDVRVRDTTRDPSGKAKANEVPDPEPDPNTDQVRLPQGSLFLELYCPRVTTANSVPGEAILDQKSKQAAPRELYAESMPGDPTTLALQLDATAPDGVPVWRLAFSVPHINPLIYPNMEGVPPAGVESPAELRNLYPNTASFDPENLDEITSGKTLAIDRFVWFRSYADIEALTNATNLVPDMEAAQTFFAPPLPINQQLLVRPGQFLVLAPRMDTRLGSSYFSGDAPDRPAKQRFEVVPDQGLVFVNEAGPTGTRTTPSLGFAATNPFAPAKPIVIGTFRPDGADWNQAFADGFVGMNVSEPMPRTPEYYPAPRDFYDGNNNYTLRDAYVDLTNPTNPALADPADMSVTPPKRRIPGFAPDPANLDSIEPRLGGILDYCSVFLQRLADPTRNFDALTNPYRTVDWITVDLNVFSGEETSRQVALPAAPLEKYISRSRMRNGHGRDFLNFPDVLEPRRNVLFSYETNEPEADASVEPTGIGGEPFFKFVAGGASHIRNSFSFLNTQFPIGPPGISSVNDTFDGFSPSIGMTRSLMPNVADGSPLVTGFDRNLPQVPLAHHPWLNRPFATPLELMMVPACSQGRLLEEFSIPREAAEPLVYSEDAPVIDDLNSVRRFVGPFRHLLNFFYGDARGPIPDATDYSGRLRRIDFSRVFDFVHTLPRFRGEVEMISPSRITDGSLTELYSPPFNFRVENRRQGRVNLNTIESFPVWAGLMQGHLIDNEAQSFGSTQQLSFNRFKQSRKGYEVFPGTAPLGFGGGPTINYDPTRFNPAVPTEFAGVYRGHQDAEFAPNTRSNPDLLRRRSVDASYLRRLDFQVISDPPGSPPQAREEAAFVRALDQIPVEPTTPPAPADPTLPTVPVGDFSQSRLRNPFTRYQTAMRMPNLASDNSQSYVVRMTIGFFEVDPVNESLGREYNEDIGQNERYQAMFIIDRSRPVGFKPGQNLNARDVVVFEKYYQ